MNKPVAFKVKTTAPRLYCVRPNSEIIEPNQSLEVQSKYLVIVIMLVYIHVGLYSYSPSNEDGARAWLQM
jgi:hypothetical protein